MSQNIYSKIIGTGSYIPKKQVKNIDFLNHKFYDSTGNILDKPNAEIVDKFLEITTIAERRYVSDELLTSDISFYAAEKAIASAQIDKEDLDHIIIAHNFGDIHNNNRTDILPSLASKVKQMLQIENPYTVTYDMIFGCPGWVQAMIQADYYIKSGDAKNVLVIGADTLSKIIDPHDRDTMIFADGAGAVVLQAKESTSPIGILKHATRSDTLNHSKMLVMGKSNNPDYENKDDLFLKMNGRRLYQYALQHVPQAIKMALDKANIHISEVNKVLIHQANGKMDEAILQRLYKLYDIKEFPEDVMPMTIDYLGNSSVATIPTLLDLILNGKLENHEINKGEIIVFASVGAGMNINAVVYKM